MLSHGHSEKENEWEPVRSMVGYLISFVYFTFPIFILIYIYINIFITCYTFFKHLLENDSCTMYVLSYCSSPQQNVKGFNLAQKYPNHRVKKSIWVVVSFLR